MTVQSNLDAAVVDLKAELDAMDFLDKGASTTVDQALIDAIQADIDTLTAAYSVEFEVEWETPHGDVTAEMLAHWLFDDEDHRLTMHLWPTNTDESITFTATVPFPWR